MLLSIVLGILARKRQINIFLQIFSFSCCVPFYFNCNMSHISKDSALIFLFLFMYFICSYVFKSLSIFLIFHQFKHNSGKAENLHLAITTHSLVSFLNKCPVTSSDKPTLDSQLGVSFLPASLFLALKSNLASVVFTEKTWFPRG